MTQYNASGDKGFEAGADLADGVIVKLSADKVVVATAGTDVAIGVTVGTAKNGQTANIRLRSAQGTTVVLAGGTIAKGDKLTATTGGKAVKVTTAGHEVVGVALEAAASGDLFEMMPSNSTLSVPAT